MRKPFQMSVSKWDTPTPMLAQHDATVRLARDSLVFKFS
jgi:hypothetical protein